MKSATSVPMPSRRCGLLLALLLGLILGCGGGEHEPQPVISKPKAKDSPIEGVSIPLPALERPNLMLISIDTLRADFLGCYGYERNTSPALDELAAAGARFDDAVAASPWTLPSHASMLSGLYPSRHGVLDHNFELTTPTLGTLLQAAGYQTMAIVNTKNVGAKRFGMLRGFTRSHYEQEVMPITLADGSLAPGKAVVNKGRKIIDRATQWLAERDPNVPFFMFLHFYDVHTDLTPSEKWIEKFVGEYHGTLDGTTGQLVQIRYDQEQLQKTDIEWLKEMYAAELRTFDNVLAKFLRRLRETGLLDSTVLLVTSDHGEEFFEHGSVLHGRTYYEEQTRIPLILHGPGIPAGFSSDRPVHLIDVAPTLLSLAGLQPTRMDGLDMTRAWFERDALPAGRLLFAEADHNNLVDGVERPNIRRMLRKGEHKLIYDTVTGRKELYNLERDPLELDDLSSQEPELLASLFQELEEFRKGETQGRDVGPLSEEDEDVMGALGYSAIPDEDE